ncbi:hypothetical protein SODALDRAFT_361207 [Sodiomyces alkalinus F11]|uniref:Uncharacterized protein n=1 Tax=Sodiomyces alkalinus (strain CBS 110278 / VKM F-3762 / F11) TaxID=1314773 RepID=A0A3N2PSP0_SODAK|nr:hypothetical protein SODALDRAFT_361207 [Sodiomyces alkalinus F11]ROT37498.1 hypothetical protein SODALDRAFT_361207 [Sodiomyces alkalinus F11]
MRPVAPRCMHSAQRISRIAPATLRNAKRTPYYWTRAARIERLKQSLVVCNVNRPTFVKVAGGSTARGDDVMHAPLLSVSKMFRSLPTVVLGGLGLTGAQVGYGAKQVVKAGNCNTGTGPPQNIHELGASHRRATQAGKCRRLIFSFAGAHSRLPPHRRLCNRGEEFDFPDNLFKTSLA